MSAMQLIRRWQKNGLALAGMLALFSPQAKAAEPAWPAGLVMGWRIIGIDAEEAAAAKTALASAKEALENRLFSSRQKLLETPALSNQPLTLNLKRELSQVVSGPLRSPASIPLSIEPVWCSLMDYHLIFLTVVDAKKHVLVASSHKAIKRTDWASSASSSGLANDLGGHLETLAAQLETQMSAPAKEPASDALHLSFKLGRHVSRRDEGSSHCVTMLVEEKLAPTFTIARAVGHDRLASVRQALGLPTELRRPTRVLNLSWYNVPESGPKRQLPVSLKVEASSAESVFGRPIPDRHTSEVQFAAADQRISFDLNPGLMNFLEQEKKALTLSDWPRVVKVRGAWAYLDRGRAWGLKMTDRMVAQADGKPIKGHVVRYFGPEEKLMSQRGFPIQEGAILYIRKGQKLVKPEMEFRFDPRAFPTSWPPPPPANTK